MNAVKGAETQELAHDRAQLENALDALARGFAVFPCLPRSKQPAGKVVPHGVMEASTDESTIRGWWKIDAEFNPAVTNGVIVDADAGLSSLQEAENFALLNDFPPTLIVRTGRRDSYGAQFHFSGTAMNGLYSANRVRGEVRCKNEYGMAPGAIHPITGERYEIGVDLPRAPVPADLLKDFRTDKSTFNASDTQITTLENARETFSRLLFRAAHAPKGSRNHCAHALTWFAARAHLAGVFEPESIFLFQEIILFDGWSEAEIKRTIFDAVSPLYKGEHRNIRKMLADSWRYGTERGKLNLALHPEDFILLQSLGDDGKFQAAWDGKVNDFPHAVAAKKYMASRAGWWHRCHAHFECLVSLSPQQYQAADRAHMAQQLNMTVERLDAAVQEARSVPSCESAKPLEDRVFRVSEARTIHANNLENLKGASPERRSGLLHAAAHFGARAFGAGLLEGSEAEVLDAIRKSAVASGMEEIEIAAIESVDWAAGVAKPLKIFNWRVMFHTGAELLNLDDNVPFSPR